MEKTNDKTNKWERDILNRWGQQPKAAKWICSRVEYASVTLCTAAAAVVVVVVVVAASATAKITTAETYRKQRV